VVVKPAQSRICGGIFTPDLDLPADHRGLRTCRCGLVGKPGDPHHDTRPPDEADHGQLAAGEGGEE
jgi:hypothetical protein